MRPVGLLSSIGILFVAVVCGMAQRSSERPVLRVAVAANARTAFDDLALAFEGISSIRLEPVVAASGTLTAQIRNGAPYDIFLSADTSYPWSLWRAEFALDSPAVYAHGRLALWARNGIDLSPGLSVLTGANIRRIALPNPRTAPYGKAALDLLRSTKLLDPLEKKLVYGESVAQVNHYLASGVCDAGFTALSTLDTKELDGKGISIVCATTTSLAQGVVILNAAAPRQAAAREFVQFLLSETGRNILKRHHYLTP